LLFFFFFVSWSGVFVSWGAKIVWFVEAARLRGRGKKNTTRRVDMTRTSIRANGEDKIEVEEKKDFVRRN
jgi:hypothetical protein